MRTLWTFFKIIVGFAIAIPVGILLLALTFGVLGALIGLATMALKFAVIAVVGYGLFRLARSMIAPTPKPAVPEIRELPPVDPYYEAAMRELNTELGHERRN